MARKRMIAPSIWESESFSDLSDFSKLVFISLISHADDEGRGKAKAATITNITFPNDDNRRVADVKKALSEIALKMSVQFYSVDGREYYAMTNWLDYQKIDKPTKSKLPPPPIVGEGGVVPNNGNITDNSGSNRGVIGESSSPNIIEDNIREDNNTPHSAGARMCEEVPDGFAEQFKAFCNEYDIQNDNYSAIFSEMDFIKLHTAYAESKTFLQIHPVAKTLSWICKNYRSIIAGKYKDKPEGSGRKSFKQLEHERATKILRELYEEARDGNDDA